jgi:hypothetical protein
MTDDEMLSNIPKIPLVFNGKGEILIEVNNQRYSVEQVINIIQRAGDVEKIDVVISALLMAPDEGKEFGWKAKEISHWLLNGDGKDGG